MKRNTCIVDTMYTLFLYLTYVPEEDIRNTVFVVDTTIPQSVCDKLPRYIRPQYPNIEKLKHGKTLRRIAFRLKVAWYNLTTLRGRRLYAQDHLRFSEEFIGRKSYVLMEDAPGVYTLAKDSTVFDWFTSLPNTRYARILHYISYGFLFDRRLGMNPYCTNRWVTDPKDLTSPYLKDKKYELIDLRKLWTNCTEKKRRLVLDIIGLDDSILLGASERSTIILSQPLVEDCHLSEEEMLSIWKPIVDQYGAQNVVVKPHPRDKFDYTILGSDINIMKTKVPMQVLCILGIKFERAITVCSTAVSMFGSDVEIVKLGSHINPKIAAVYG